VLDLKLHALAIRVTSFRETPDRAVIVVVRDG